MASLQVLNSWRSSRGGAEVPRLGAPLVTSWDPARGPETSCPGQHQWQKGGWALSCSSTRFPVPATLQRGGT